MLHDVTTKSEQNAGKTLPRAMIYPIQRPAHVFRSQRLHVPVSFNYFGLLATFCMDESHENIRKGFQIDPRLAGSSALPSRSAWCPWRGSARA